VKQQNWLFLLALALPAALLGGCSTLTTAPRSEAGNVPERVASEPAVPPLVTAPEPETVESKTEAVSETIPDPIVHDPIALLCAEIGAKLGSVSTPDCLRQNLQASSNSVQQRALAYKDYPPLAGKPPLGRVLLIGGIHGDEFSSVSVVFKWMDILNTHHSGRFYLRSIPLLNPDGLLRKVSQRQNEHGVDLNRNFPTTDWNASAYNHWVEVTASNVRRYPGSAGASEPETRWLIQQIKDFAPDIIISIHAPHHLVDYDGPPSAPQQLGKLSLRQLGVYPGSLGNYAGKDMRLPVVTVELRSAGIMPPKSEIDGMWGDLVQWLQQQLTQTAATPKPGLAE